jgi:hypothetical protein
MKLLKSIKLYKKLRKKQEQLFEECYLWSQGSNRHEPWPKLNEYKSVNKSVRKICRKIPNIALLIDCFIILKNH